MSEFAPPNIASVALSTPASDYQPRSFHERGAAVPFTTPILCGALVRQGPRQGPELVVCNPSGGRGVYVLPWSGIDTICQPTLHDIALQAEIARLGDFTPGTIRRAARAVAVTGIAGRGARHLAEQAAPGLAEAQAHNHALLREMLLRQCAPGQENSPPQTAILAELIVRVEAAIVTLATRLRCPATALGASLLAVGDLLAELRVAIGDPAPAAIAAIGDLARTLRGLHTSLPGPLGQEAARVAATAQTSQACATSVLADIGAALDDLPTLLHRFVRAPAEVIAQFSRIDWVLDGWDRAAWLWREATAAGPQPSRGALIELLAQIPRLPAEAIGWMPPNHAKPTLPDDARPAPLADADAAALAKWRSLAGRGDLVARNERLLASAVAA